MHRVLFFIAAALILASVLVACGGEEKAETATPTAKATTTATATGARTATPVATKTPQVTATRAPTKTPETTPIPLPSTPTPEPSTPTPLPPTPTPEPPTPTPAPAALSVEIVSVTSPVSQGANATAVAQTSPGANCSITVTYKSGPSKAQGLVPKTADASGQVSWTWKVGTNTTPGDWPIDITCSLGGQSQSARSSITVQ